MRATIECSMLYNDYPGFINGDNDAVSIVNPVAVFAFFHEISKESIHAPSILADTTRLTPA